MTLCKILDILADAECELYHMATDNPDREKLMAACIATREAIKNVYAEVQEQANV